MNANFGILPPFRAGSCAEVCGGAAACDRALAALRDAALARADLSFAQRDTAEAGRAPVGSPAGPQMTPLTSTRLRAPSSLHYLPVFRYHAVWHDSCRI